MSRMLPLTRMLPLFCLALTHTLVDTCALLIEPLWPAMQSRFALGMVALSVTFVIQSMPTSISQAVFGYLRDRRGTPYWLWLGPVLAALFLPLMGLAPNSLVLCVLLIAGGIGVGAFHPEAAVTAGRMMPEQRTRALSVFMFGGALGLALGPTLSGAVVSTWGLGGLVYLGPPIILLVVILRRLGRLAEAAPRPAKPTTSRSIGQMLDGRVHVALFLLLICSFRLVPNMAVHKVLAFTLGRRGYSELDIGLYQTLFLVSASAGMFLMALRFRSGWEKRFMIGCPLLGAPVLFALGSEACPEWLFVTCLVLGGAVLWGTTPAMVSFGQQLFPNGAGIASAITMGLAWGLGGLIQAPLTAYFQESGTPQQAFHAFIPCLLIAAAGAWFLPSPNADTGGQSGSTEPAVDTEHTAAADAKPVSN